MKLKFHILPSLLVEVLFFSLIISSCNKKNPVQPEENTFGISKYFYYEDIAMWNHVFKETDAFVIPQGTLPVSILIPHHDLTIQRQNSIYKALAEQMQPSVIVIVAPDHFECGQNLITMPQSTVFKAPDGDLEIDYSLISQIKENESVKNKISFQDDLWFNEHGIYTHTPFLKHYFPDAKVVPVLVKMLSTDEEFEYFTKFGKVLSELLPSDSLLVASVDCSHYQIPAVTKLHDEVIYNTIQNLEDPRFAEIDSPESVQVLYSYNECRNTTVPVLINHTSTYDFIPQENVESTSHFYWTFYTKEILPFLDDYYNQVAKTNQRFKKADKNKIAQTVLITGSGKTGAGIRKTWIWDRYNTSTNRADILLKNAAGKEARFFYGFDALIFDPEVDSIYERTLHNTTLKVHTIAQKDFEKTLTQKIADQKQTVKILEVVLDGKKELPADEKINSMMEKFNVVVFRDDDGKEDAFMFYKDSSKKVEKVNLGICHGNGDIKGCVAVLSFDGEEGRLSTFEYESADGIIPAIHQFIPEE